MRPARTSSGHQVDHLLAADADDQHPRRGREGPAQPPRLGLPLLRPRVARSRRRVGDEQPRRDRHDGHPQEDPAPADQLGDVGGEDGAHEGGQHPRRRQHGEHPRPHRLGVGLRDHDVEGDAEHAAAVPVHEATEHEDRHGRREAGDDHTGAEDHQAQPQGRPGTDPVDLGDRSQRARRHPPPAARRTPRRTTAGRRGRRRRRASRSPPRAPRTRRGRRGRRRRPSSGRAGPATVTPPRHRRGRSPGDLEDDLPDRLPRLQGLVCERGVGEREGGADVRNPAPVGRRRRGPPSRTPRCG